jgi:serine/threonine protein kinase
MQSDRVGQQLGNYRLLKLLGKGGFAQVYLGEHIHLQSEAAIKVLNETRLTPEDQQGFRAEARTIRGLKHPHIVKVLEFGIEKSLREADAGVPYLVMEYAPNGTLRDRHPRNSIVSLDQIGLYTDQMADALQYAHNQFIVHCDVKPENMLIAGQNDILLSDFGIAVTGHTSNNPSALQKLQGTIAYVAPERLEKGITEPACDQYALGVIVYEWLTGVRPFEGTQDQIISQHLHTPPPPLYRVYSRITQDIEQVVMRALAKDPKQRYSSVKEFARDLSHALLSASRTQQASPGFQAVPNPQPASANPQVQANPVQQPKVTPVFQAPPTSQTAPASAQPQTNSAQPQQGPVRLGSSPGQSGQVNATTSVYGSTSSRMGRQDSMLNQIGRDGFLGLWNTVFQAQGDTFELYGEFGRLRKNKAFRDSGFILNVIAAALIGVLSQPPSVLGACIAGLFSFAMFYFCIHFVNKTFSLLCGLLIALYWGYTGLVIGNWLATLSPAIGAYSAFLGLVFLCVSAYLHVRYVESRLP